MSEPLPKGNGNPAQEWEAHIDQVCDRFEAAWKEALAGRGDAPAVEDFLGDSSDAERTELQNELLALDKEYRSKGLKPKVIRAPGTPGLPGRTPHVGSGQDPDLHATQAWQADPDEVLDLSAQPEESLEKTIGHVPSSEQVGPVFASRYKLLEKILEGGMGVVWRARQRVPNRLVALKMLHRGLFSSAEALRRLVAEAEAVARLNHAHIVPVYEVGEYAGEPFFSMRLMEGGSLAQRLAAAPLSNREAARVLALLARAAHYAHSNGIIHRDLKPANVLFDSAGEPSLADFGLAMHLRPGVQVSANIGGVVGTACYMAPEQATGSAGHQMTARVDVYGLGATLYEMLVGRPPFKAATFEETLRQVRQDLPARPILLNPQVDPALEAICLMCLEKSPGDRYASAGDLADDLERYLLGHTTQAEKRTGPMRRLLRGMTRYPDSRPDALRTWSTISLWVGVFMILGHVGTFALIRIGTGPLIFLIGDVLNWMSVTLVFWWYLGRRDRPLGPRERQIVGLTQIVMIGLVTLAWASLPLALADAAKHRLTLYPAFMINTGLLYLLQGRLWVGFYLIGGLSIAIAFSLGFWPELGPLTYAAVHGTCLLGFSLFLELQARRAARTRTDF